MEYERSPRFAGQSKYNFFSLIKLAKDGIFNFSTKPLKIILTVGLTFSIFSFLLLVLFLAQRILNITIFGLTPRDVPGWSSIIIILLLFSGLQILLLGVLGEYISRIYEEVKQRKVYIID